jgi:hypothetical protein
VVLVIVIGSSIAHSLAEPSPSNPDFLNPTSTTAIGGKTLADRLAAQGIQVHRVTKSSDALLAGYDGNTTVFVPTPGLMHPYYLRMLKLLPATTRVVLVEPSGIALSDGHIPVGGTGTRWATRTVAPGCDLPEAQRAGRAEVFHTHYTGGEPNCYQGALAGAAVGSTEVLVVGANEPFRNDEIARYGNAALATGLLSAHPSVTWLDLHQSEPAPGVINSAAPGAPAAPPSLSENGSPDPDFTIPQQGGNDGGGENAGGSAGSPPLLSTIPPALWAFLVLALLAVIALALARGRRLGPPVTEPLPVAVRGAETVEGRGRLYRRAQARGTALGALRTSALRRLLPALDLDPDSPAATVVAQVAARTGRPADEVDAILYGPAPSTDAELVQAVAQLDALTHQTLADAAVGRAANDAAGQAAANAAQAANDAAGQAAANVAQAKGDPQ